ncbi:MAG: PD-(D/E)XK nuclease family protein [Planctomycetes bacterium]|nr:PD-(D/E)XK nuclease family protein [Planctomycetota bacterium]
MKNDIIHISAKNLGALAMPNCCPHCFWLKLNCKLPYQIFPGIFSSIDSYSKKITWGYYEKFNSLPDWFKPFGDFARPVKAPGRSVFFVDDERTNIKLTGVVDDIFQKKDGSYFIVDYKTSRFTRNQDALLPIYRVQLNGYALIAEKCGLKPVTGIGLLYYEPQTNAAVDIDQALLNDGFAMPFKAYLHELQLKPKEIVYPLLKRARQIADLSRPPKGNTSCQDCQKLEDLIRVVASQ